MLRLIYKTFRIITFIIIILAVIIILTKALPIIGVWFEKIQRFIKELFYNFENTIKNIKV